MHDGTEATLETETGSEATLNKGDLRMSKHDTTNVTNAQMSSCQCPTSLVLVYLLKFGHEISNASLADTVPSTVGRLGGDGF